MVNCSVLAPDQHFYKLEFKPSHPTITIDTTPKPLVLTLRAMGRSSARAHSCPGWRHRVRILRGRFNPGHTETTTTAQEHTVSRDPSVSDQNLSLHPNTLTGTETTYSTTSTYVPGTSTAPHASFSPKRVTCPALNLSSKGASVGMETMQPISSKPCSAAAKDRQRRQAFACTVSTLPPLASACSSSRSL